jgi:hypothetical protein
MGPSVRFNCRIRKAAETRVQNGLRLSPLNIKLSKVRESTHKKVVNLVCEEFVHACDSKEEFLLKHQLRVNRLVARLLNKEKKKHIEKKAIPFSFSALE